VQFIALFHEPDDPHNWQWPTHKLYATFWDNCAVAVQQFSGESLRTGEHHNKNEN
jgi:hypothetical protein